MVTRPLCEGNLPAHWKPFCPFLGIVSLLPLFLRSVKRGFWSLATMTVEKQAELVRARVQELRTEGLSNGEIIKQLVEEHSCQRTETLACPWNYSQVAKFARCSYVAKFTQLLEGYRPVPAGYSTIGLQEKRRRGGGHCVGSSPTARPPQYPAVLLIPSLSVTLALKPSTPSALPVSAHVLKT